MPRKVELLVPTGVVTTQSLPLAPRPADLRGRVIGLLDNGKSNTAPFLARLAERLPEAVSGATIVSQAKPTAARPAAGEVLELLAQRCDVVINGIAD
jgi:hypothetical protein